MTIMSRARLQVKKQENYDRAVIVAKDRRIRDLEAALRTARGRINQETGDCCEAEKRNMNGGCTNCGDPCL